MVITDDTISFFSTDFKSIISVSFSLFLSSIAPLKLFKTDGLIKSFIVSKFPLTKLLSTISKKVFDPFKKSTLLKLGSTFKILSISILFELILLDFNETTFEYCFGLFFSLKLLSSKPVFVPNKFFNLKIKKIAITPNINISKYGNPFCMFVTP